MSDEEKRMKIGNYEFKFLQELIPERNDNGEIVKYCPQNKYSKKETVQLNQHGVGAFCKFKICAQEVSCVYAWVCDKTILYIGETENLRKRFNTGYGNISPKNCYKGGQPTNCKMNKVLLKYAELNKRIDLYYFKTANHKKIEGELIDLCQPKYND